MEEVARVAGTPRGADPEEEVILVEEVAQVVAEDRVAEEGGRSLGILLVEGPRVQRL